MISYLLVNLAVPWLSPAARLAAVAYLPLLYLRSGISRRPLYAAWRYVALFGGVLLAVQLVGALLAARTSIPSGQADTAFWTTVWFLLQPNIRTTLLMTLPGYALFLSLGIWLLRTIPAAELQEKLLRSLPDWPGFRQVSAVAGLAFGLFLRLRGISLAIHEALVLRSVGRTRLRSARNRAIGLTRMGTELALGTAEALILRGYGQSTAATDTTARRAAGRAAGRTAGRAARHAVSLWLSLLPLLLLAAVDILYTFIR
ncbi:hypothetical protein [Spirochaeta africana]|uniref:Uncharacterized protein n=1 Tax=Spirochaeta africana (strain ATCC 700263 / DSM 8902 / Z-7692) TaxID=889378 RepID=H9UHS4_SPIAZ|nr:hypothetical protein [Spirochaeta africana]AFG37067.1 hypothetical protein Spiaf_0979 [Spirochaeta africana DSM 8902]